MKLDTLRNAFVHELRDLLSAERQLTEALPKMAEGATNGELAKGFKEHLHQTEEHVNRLERLLKDLGETARAEKCEAMEGLVAEGSEILEKKGAPEVVDAMLVAAAQRVEHYEIAAYGTARAFAEILGEDEAAKTLQQTLDEESETNEKLTTLATHSINPKAASVGGD